MACTTQLRSCLVSPRSEKQKKRLKFLDNKVDKKVDNLGKVAGKRYFEDKEPKTKAATAHPHGPRAQPMPPPASTPPGRSEDVRGLPLLG